MMQARLEIKVHLQQGRWVGRAALHTCLPAIRMSASPHGSSLLAVPCNQISAAHGTSKHGEKLSAMGHRHGELQYLPLLWHSTVTMTRCLLVRVILLCAPQ